MRTIDLKDIREVNLEDIKPIEDPTQLESALRGAAQGATLGFADELTAAGEAVGRGVLSKIPGLDVSDKSYEQSLQESRQAYKEAQKANPVTYGLSEVGGGVGSALVNPGGILAKIAGKGAITGGAALGALAGLGSTEADKTSIEALKEAGQGALTGGVTGAAFSGLGKVIDAYKGSKLRNLVKSGVDIDNPLAAQKIEEKFASSTGEQLGKIAGELGQGRETIVTQATGRGRFKTPEFSEEALANAAASFADDPHTLSQLNKLSTLAKKPDLTADEFKRLNTLLNDLSKTREGRFINNPDLRQLTQEGKQSIINQLPKEWSEANQLYHTLLTDVVEPTLLEGGKYSKVGAQATVEKAKEHLGELVGELARGDKNALKQLERLRGGLQTFEERSPGLIESASGIDPSKLTKDIASKAAEVKALGEYQTPISISPTDAAHAVFSPKTAAAGIALKSKVGAKFVGNLAKAEQSASEAYTTSMEALKKYTPSQLSEVADSLINNVATSRLGQQLKQAVQTNDPVKKSAAIFNALQNPQAKAIIMPATQEPPVKQE